MAEEEKFDAVIVGADRVAANGDVANKVGTYTLAVLARAHSVPFYVAAPLSTVDLSTPRGDAIPIEERAPEEVTTVAGVRVAPAGVVVRNPAFDVTPHAFVTAIVTEARHDDVTLGTTPSFTAGGIIRTVAGLYLGQTLVLHPRFDPEAVVDEIERSRVTMTTFIPTMLMRTLKVLAENLLRTEDGLNVTPDHVTALTQWDPAAEPAGALPGARAT